MKSKEEGYDVRWAEQAVRDLESVIAYVAHDAPLNARKILERIREAAAALRELPDRGRVVPELARFGVVGFRELIVNPYRLVYRIDSNAVFVLAVFDGRRDIQDVLFDRLLRS